MFIIDSRDCHVNNNSSLMTQSKGKPPTTLSHMLILRLSQNLVMRFKTSLGEKMLVKLILQFFFFFFFFLQMR